MEKELELYKKLVDELNTNVTVYKHLCVKLEKAKTSNDTKTLEKLKSDFLKNNQIISDIEKQLKNLVDKK